MRKILGAVMAAALALPILVAPAIASIESGNQVCLDAEDAPNYKSGNVQSSPTLAQRRAGRHRHEVGQLRWRYRPRGERVGRHRVGLKHRLGLKEQQRHSHSHNEPNEQDRRGDKADSTSHLTSPRYGNRPGVSRRRRRRWNGPAASALRR